MKLTFGNGIAKQWHERQRDREREREEKGGNEERGREAEELDDREIGRYIDV